MTDDAQIQLIDHIGVNLWTAAEAWKAAYTKAMVDAGYGYFAGAGFAILQFVGPQGARPAEIARRLGISRQAVQQLIDTLERDGVLTRSPDTQDGRAKIIRLTEKGAEAHRRGNALKAEIEARISTVLGPGPVDRLKADLKKVADILADRQGAF